MLDLFFNRHCLKKRALPIRRRNSAGQFSGLSTTTILTTTTTTNAAAATTTYLLLIIKVLNLRSLVNIVISMNGIFLIEGYIQDTIPSLVRNLSVFKKNTTTTTKHVGFLSFLDHGDKSCLDGFFRIATLGKHSHLTLLPLIRRDIKNVY